MAVKGWGWPIQLLMFPLHLIVHDSPSGLLTLRISSKQNLLDPSPDSEDKLVIRVLTGEVEQNLTMALGGMHMVGAEWF